MIRDAILVDFSSKIAEILANEIDNMYFKIFHNGNVMSRYVSFVHKSYMHMLIQCLFNPVMYLGHIQASVMTWWQITSQLQGYNDRWLYI